MTPVSVPDVVDRLSQWCLFVFFYLDLAVPAASTEDVDHHCSTCHTLAALYVNLLGLLQAGVVCAL